MRQPLVTINIGGQDVTAILERIERMVSENQDKLDAISAAIDTATTGIAADIQALKDAVAAGQVLDFTALDAKVAALAALDAANPEVPVEPAP